MRRDIAADYGASPDHCSFADYHIGQDHTMRPNEHIFFDNNFSISGWPSWTGVKMRDDRTPKTDDAVVPDYHIFGMYFIEVDKLADPYVLPDRHSAQSLQPWSHTEPAGGHKSDLTGKPTKQNWQSQRFRPLILLSDT